MVHRVESGSRSIGAGVGIVLALGPGRRRVADRLVLPILLLLATAVVGCAERELSSPDREVRIAVANDGGEPLRCTILFGHWVEQDAGIVAAGAVLQVPMHRQTSDGALYVPRYDGRKMMVENLVCGPLDRWWERRSDIALVAVRAGTTARFRASCRVTDRARCSALEAAR